MTTTRLSVEVRDGRHQVRGSAGLLRAQRLHGPTDRARVALVGQTALLLGGDQVALDIEVGPGAVLELSDIAGTVAYHGRGRAASWRTSIRLGPGARCAYAGEPLILSDGSDVTRTLTVDLAEGATARLRETLVFGRADEVGGRLDATTLLRREGEEFCRERLVLDAEGRARPGVLAGVRVVDSVLTLGGAPVERREGGAGSPAVPVGDRTSLSTTSDLETYQLLETGSTLTRYLGTSLAASPLHPRS
ncbi:MAG TPA: urease accessory protein UreD [Microlunatus sp.]